ncbi:MAG: GntR family transcriptional regulator [Bryobacteraceae bacterium]
MPPYLEIAAVIRKEILSLAPHTRLASEPELVRRFGAARATIRRALAKLQQEGLIYSRQAVGTFVAEPRVEQDLDQLFSFTEFMTFKGFKPGARLLVSEVQRVEDPDSPLLRPLALRPGARVIHLRRLRLGRGRPLVVANTWLPEALFRGFLEHDLRRHSVYDVMRRMGHPPTDALQTIEAVSLAGPEARLLDVPAGAAALLIRRVAYSRGLPVEYAVDYYRGDRTTFRVRLGVLEQRLGFSG